MLMQLSKWRPVLMWLVPMSFFSYQFILRLWPGLMMNPIMEQLSIDASEFGVLAAYYYYGYAGLSIPVAILLDRFGARYIVALGALLCGMATLVFTYTDSYYMALGARFVVGAGSAVGFLGVSKVVSEWFSKESYARMIGLSFTFGLMGAIYGGKPVSVLIETYEWQNVALAFAAVAIVIAGVSYVCLSSPELQREAAETEGVSAQKPSYRAVFSSPIIWLLGVSNLLMVGSLEGFADVWGITYLVHAYSITKSDAAGLVSLVFVGMLFGGPILAACSKKVGDYAVVVGAGLVMMSIFIILFANPLYDPLLLSVLFFVLGVMCCYQVIVFSAGANLVASQNLGVAVAFLNCVNMLGGSFFHTVIGRTLDFFWTGSIADGIKTYDLEAYKYAISIIPICTVLGSALMLFIGVYAFKQNKQDLAMKA
jgi:sugar phosphate permease